MDIFLKEQVFQFISKDRLRRVSLIRSVSLLLISRRVSYNFCFLERERCECVASIHIHIRNSYIVAANSEFQRKFP